MIETVVMSETQKVALWMVSKSYATGHGDTVEDMLDALDWQAQERGQRAAAAYGRSTPELLARFDPDTSSWRTSQLCLDGAYHEFSETWPRSGLMRNGTAYQNANPALTT